MNYNIPTQYSGIELLIWPQLATIIWGTLLFALLVIYVGRKVSKEDPLNPTSAVAVIAINLFEAFENLIDSVTGGKLKKAYPYLFTLFGYIFIMSMMSLLGFTPAPTSIFFTFALGLITFIGMFVVGIGTKGLLQFGKEKYGNPIEIFAQFAPLMSISIRLFGATLATTVISEIFTIIFLSLSGSAGVDGTPMDIYEKMALQIWPIISGLWAWLLSLTDIFFSAIQAFVFTFLTTIYWMGEYGASWDKTERNEFYQMEAQKKREIKELKLKQKQEKKALASVQGSEQKEILAVKGAQ